MLSPQNHHCHQDCCLVLITTTWCTKFDTLGTVRGELNTDWESSTLIRGWILVTAWLVSVKMGAALNCGLFWGYFSSCFSSCRKSWVSKKCNPFTWRGHGELASSQAQGSCAALPIPLYEPIASSRTLLLHVFLHAVRKGLDLLFCSVFSL